MLIHCSIQHELICSRCTNAENEERIFKSAESSVNCTDRKPENMLPGVNPLQNLCQSNSRIAKSANQLPSFKGTVFSADYIRKQKYAY